MGKLLNLPVAIVVGFFESVAVVIALFLSIVGIVVIYAAHAILLAGIQMIYDFASRPMPTKIDNDAYFILFLFLWLAATAAHLQGYSLFNGISDADDDEE